MRKDIIQLIDDLSWDASIADQAAAVSDLIPYMEKHANALIWIMQTLSEKQFWGNQAKVVVAQCDATLERYVPRMLEWLKDSNWPGWDEIFLRLIKMPDDYVSRHIEDALRWAKTDKDVCWESNLIRLREERERTK